ncbi:hypothetical protein [Deinococcus roseus]|uniref:Uncharacterized protein n=1 Tax=Deinococcus roseus TaxID=392414 RepID=A0ABQ2CYQ0_9DEIO|nr:hypothetical protein [Deinococcus roseus]GGJ33478.1 hypothetical protein GCM10008938_19650 [Deinococcus roseus]
MEVNVRIADLGVRFFDPILGAFVEEGLQVGVHPVGFPHLHRTLTSNRVGVYHLPPKLVQTEAGHFASTTPHELTVQDTLGRYLPYSLKVNLPLQGRFDGGSGKGYLLLYPAPSYPVSQGMQVYASLRTLALEPMPWAAVKVTLGTGGKSTSSIGLADQNGEVYLSVPYPAYLPLGSKSLMEQKYPVAVEVGWDAAQKASPMPELTAALGATLSSVTVTPTSIAYGQRLVLRSSGSSFLLV